MHPFEDKAEYKNENAQSTYSKYIKKLLLARKNQNNEFYTQMKTVKKIFEEYIPRDFWKDKIIYCPCDSEESNFVKYLKENELDLQYKKLIYTSDLWQDHTDLFDECDVIITNPPFSKINDWINNLGLRASQGKYFFSFGALNTLFNYYFQLRKYLSDEQIHIYNENYREYTFFDTPSGEEKNIRIIYATNIPGCNIKENNHKPFSLFNTMKEHQYILSNDNQWIMNIDQLNQLPFDYPYYLAVPSSVVFDYYRKYVDIIKYDDQLRFLYITDDRLRYVRVLVKIKPEYLKEPIDTKLYKDTLINTVEEWKKSHKDHMSEYQFYERYKKSYNDCLKEDYDYSQCFE